VPNDYTSSTDVFADIPEGNYASSTDFTTVYKPAMDNFVTVASRLIDAEMGRWGGFFYPTTDASTDFYYDGSGLEEQEIDEFVSISAVAVAEQGGVSSTCYTAWTENTDYLVWPYNATAKGRPLTKLVIDVIDGSKAAWYRYQRAVKVTGVPGYSATPPDIIVQACKLQAVRWFFKAKQGYQEQGASVEFGSMRFTASSTAPKLDPDIKALLWPIKLELER